MNKALKLVATLLFAYIFLITLMVVLSNLADDGIFREAWFSVLEGIPFGGELGKAVLNLVEQSLNLSVGLNTYQPAVATNGLSFLEDFCKLILTAITFEPAEACMEKLLGEPEGIVDRIVAIIMNMLTAIACTFLSAVLLRFFFVQLVKLPMFAQGFLSCLISMITLGGSVWVMYVLLGGGILIAVLHVLVKIIIVGTLKLEANYVGLLLCILFLSEKAYLKAAGVAAGWFVVMFMILGIDLMFSSIKK